jgi:hypothetical protein
MAGFSFVILKDLKYADSSFSSFTQNDTAVYLYFIYIITTNS